jgi:hypothetical protein
MSASRMRIAVTADTRNFDAAMKHVRGQAAQARRAVAPTLGAMGMGGAGRMAGMGLGMAAMAGPMGAIAAATAAVATAVNAIKTQTGDQDKALQEAIAQGLNEMDQTNLTRMAQLVKSGGTAAEMVGLIRQVRGLDEQKQQDLESTIGPDLMRDLMSGNNWQFFEALRQAQQKSPQVAEMLGGAGGAATRAIGGMDASLISSAIQNQFGTFQNLQGAAMREQARRESVANDYGAITRFFDRFGAFVRSMFGGGEPNQIIKSIERVGSVPV